MSRAWSVESNTHGTEHVDKIFFISLHYSPPTGTTLLAKNGFIMRHSTTTPPSTPFLLLTKKNRHGTLLMFIPQACFLSPFP